MTRQLSRTNNTPKNYQNQEMNVRRFSFFLYFYRFGEGAGELWKELKLKKKKKAVKRERERMRLKGSPLKTCRNGKRF